MLGRLKINLDAEGLMKAGVGSIDCVLRRLKINLDAEGLMKAGVGSIAVSYTHLTLPTNHRV